MRHYLQKNIRKPYVKNCTFGSKGGWGTRFVQPHWRL